MIRWVENRFKIAGVTASSNAYFSEEESRKAKSFHASMPDYKPSPLYELSDLSDYINVGGIYVKDESHRFGLNAFKGLGASYAMASYFADQLGIELSSTGFDRLIQQVQTMPKATFITATDGNHGKGVAWAASLFQQHAKVYMPKGTAHARLTAIQSLGADVCITDMNYDDTVQSVRHLAALNQWILMQDTVSDGDEKILLSIMKGYTTIVSEIVEQLNRTALNEMTHIILQAGVGSFAAAIAAAIYNLSSGKPPKILIVEPSKADCFYQSILHPSGEPQRVYGDLDTIMAGLACGEPNPIAWEMMKQLGDYFFSCDDYISEKGMRVLGNPMGKDARIISGESGAVPLGLLYELMTNPEYEEDRKKLGLNESSKILIINTEGDTDPVNYRKVVWC